MLLLPASRFSAPAFCANDPGQGPGDGSKGSLLLCLAKMDMLISFSYPVFTFSIDNSHSPINPLIPISIGRRGRRARPRCSQPPGSAVQTLSIKGSSRRVQKSKALAAAGSMSIEAYQDSRSRPRSTRPGKNRHHYGLSIVRVRKQLLRGQNYQEGPHLVHCHDFACLRKPV